MHSIIVIELVKRFSLCLQKYMFGLGIKLLSFFYAVTWFSKIIFHSVSLSIWSELI